MTEPMTGGATTNPVNADNPYGDKNAATQNPSAPSDEYVERMVAKANGETAPEKLYAGKYKTEEDLHKGMLEVLKHKYGGNLEEAYKAIAGQSPANGVGDADGETGETGATGGSDVKGDSTDIQNTRDGSTDSDDKGDTQSSNPTELIDNATLEYAENGSLSDETYEKISKSLNASREMIDQYIEGQKAMAELAAQQVYAAVGGKEAYDSMVKWAATGLNKQQIDMFNEDIVTGDPARIARAVEMCNAAYAKANGKQGKNFLNSTNSNNTNVVGYGSLQEWKADLKDPRYKSGDKAFHSHMQNRLKHTRSF